MPDQKNVLAQKVLTHGYRAAALAGLAAILLHSNIYSVASILMISLLLYYIQQTQFPLSSSSKPTQHVHPVHQEHFHTLPDDLKSEFSELFAKEEIQALRRQPIRGQQTENNVRSQTPAPSLAENVRLKA